MISVAVNDFLESLTWDGEPRLDTWLTDVADASPESSAAFAAWARGAVRRALTPGCDAPVLVLLGPDADELCGELGGEDPEWGISSGEWVREHVVRDATVFLAEQARLIAHSEIRRAVGASRSVTVPRRHVYVVRPFADRLFFQAPVSPLLVFAELVKLNIGRAEEERSQMWAEAVATYDSASSVGAS